MQIIAYILPLISPYMQWALEWEDVSEVEQHNSRVAKGSRNNTIYRTCRIPWKERTNARQIVTEQVSQQIEQHPAEDIAIYSAQCTPSIDKRVRPTVGSGIDEDTEHADKLQQQENKELVSHKLDESPNVYTDSKEKCKQHEEWLQNYMRTASEKMAGHVEYYDAALRARIPLTAAGQIHYGTMERRSGLNIDPTILKVIALHLKVMIYQPSPEIFSM